MISIPSSAFDAITAELRRKPLQTNNYRSFAGSGKSQTFGVVGRRCLPPDYSRQNWLRPYLYSLLQEFGKNYVDISYNAITVNQNYRADKHRDKNNVGVSFLVAFGSYTGGDLLLHEGDLSGNHSVYHKPMVLDFSKVLHSVDHFTGERYSLVYYFFENSRSVPLPRPSVQLEADGKWYFYRGTQKITRQSGLPHPLKGRTRREELHEIAEED
jgi:hypothetical protein